MAGDLLAAVDHLGLASVAAFGHSVGGATVLLAELARPGVLDAAYLYEPIVWPAGFAHEGPNPMAGPARRRREEFGSRAEALVRYASRPPLGLLRADALWAYVTHGFEDLADGTVRLKCRAASEAATFEAETAMTLDRVVGVAPPVTVAVGDAPPHRARPTAARPSWRRRWSTSSAPAGWSATPTSATSAPSRTPRPSPPTSSSPSATSEDRPSGLRSCGATTGRNHTSWATAREPDGDGVRGAAPRDRLDRTRTAGAVRALGYSSAPAAAASPTSSGVMPSSSVSTSKVCSPNIGAAARGPLS